MRSWRLQKLPWEEHLCELSPMCTIMAIKFFRNGFNGERPPSRTSVVLFFKEREIDRQTDRWIDGSKDRWIDGWIALTKIGWTSNGRALGKN
eukprot:5672148-Amphidinium_carterae.1